MTMKKLLNDMNLRRAILCGMLAVCCGLLSACGEKGAQSAITKKVIVGFSQIGSESDWSAANSASVKNAAKAGGFDLRFADGQQKQENQIKALRSFVDQKVDLIAFSPVVETGWQPVLEEIKAAVSPSESLLVVDAMTGQDAVQAALEFHQRIGLTGLILTKLDGDARGGAALSITSVTGVPIKFVGTGERVDALEQFHPDRLASRILGMGDMLTLIEKAQTTFDQDQAVELEKKIRQATFDLEDFLGQLQQLKKMGPLSQIVEMIPGFSGIKGNVSPDDLDGDQLKTVEAVIHSMTQEERRRPEIIGGSRRRRIARGSGTSAQDVNQLLNQFRQMQKLMRQMTSGKGRNKMMDMLAQQQGGRPKR